MTDHHFDRDAVAALPDVVLSADPALGRTRRPRLINTGYGGSVRASFSGSSAYLAEAGMQAGALDGVFELYGTAHPDRRLQARGARWKLRRVLLRQQTGGFKYSPEFAAHVWRRHLPALAGTDVISNFQLFSDEFFDRRHEFGVGAYFYIDGTLHDYLYGYRAYDVSDIDPSMVEAAIRAERRGYHRADGLAVMSHSTAGTLVERYGVDADRVRVIPPGANLSDAMAERITELRAAREPAAEIVVGFVGVYPERKGLPKLAAAIATLRAEGRPVRLRVIGRCPPDIAAMDGVEALGYLSKSDDPGRFSRAMSGIDLGVQLSTAEMYGIAVLEYLRCGIPVLTSEVGGVQDVLRDGAAMTVPADCEVEVVAQALRHFGDDDAYRRRLGHEAASLSEQVRWDVTARALGEFVARDAGSVGGAA